MSNPKRVCVFCGSSKGNNPAFAEQARILGKHLASNEIGIVYGGGSTGIMNEVAEGALSLGGKVHGVIPKHLNNQEHTPSDITKLHITDSMHERKALMAQLSDGYIALPGGFGTFEEVMEAVTWAQLGLHKKTVIVYNIDNFYDRFIDFIDQTMEDGFISPQNRKLLKVVNSAEACIRHLSKT